MWDIAKAAVLGKPKGDVGEGGDNGPGCGHLLFARVWGSFSAILVMVFAVLNFISCFQWSMYMLCLGFITLLLEASFVAGLCDCSENFSQLLARIKPWQKAMLYCLISLPPLIACFGITTLLACGAWFGTGVVYFLLFMSSRTNTPHTVRYNAANDEAQVNLISAAAAEDDTAEKNDSPATEQSAWWPFSTTTVDAHAAPSSKPKPQHTSAERVPERQPSQEPTMTGAMPDGVPPAFPEPTLDDARAGPRTTAYTGPPVKAVTVDGPPPVLSPPTAAASGGPRTLAYTGPLIKSFGDAKPS